MSKIKWLKGNLFGTPGDKEKLILSIVHFYISFLLLRNAILQPAIPGGLDDASELLGEMYDNIFLRGHVSGEGKQLMHHNQRFVPGYLAIFL